MQKPTLAQVATSCGRGFLTGQVFATVGALSHAAVSAPKGSKIVDFSTQFSQLSKDNGVSMAQWSLVHMSIDPIVSKYIKNPIVNDIAGGAATGAVMEWRNGMKGLAIGAFQGAMQNVLMSAIGLTIKTVAMPVISYTQKQKMKKFNQERNAATFRSPINALFAAFSNDE